MRIEEFLDIISGGMRKVLEDDFSDFPIFCFFVFLSVKSNEGDIRRLQCQG